MKNVKLLDCTLRDGGYLIDSNFGDNVIKGIIKKLTDAKIDIIECGFLKDGEYLEGTTIFSDVNEIKQLLPMHRGKTSYVVLADYSRYSAKTLKPYDGTSIDGIRECFMKHERKDAMRVSKIIKDAGYKVYIQPVDVLSYNDTELLELISWVNELHPYSFSIVDTFGSMYLDDLQRIYHLINHNLISTINLGFHSHNNLQMSSALSQEFINLTRSQRNIVVDSTICGMGRGAGNTNTELIAEFLNKKFNYNYDLDILLDIVDLYMPDIMTKCTWGYTIPFFIAGIYNTHVHNITYLLDKHNIDSKNIRQVIEKIDPIKRKEYDYNNLENVYIAHVNKNIDDRESIELLRAALFNKDILLIAPGKNAIEQKNIAEDYIAKKNPIIISVNSLFNEYKIDYAFFSNYRRYEFSKEVHSVLFDSMVKIVTSNIESHDKNILVINYNDYIKQGWEHFDNSVIMLLRFLLKLNVKDIAFVGFDGYKENDSNYSEKGLEIQREKEKYNLINMEIREMLIDLKLQYSERNFTFITDSIFNNIFQ